MRFALLSLSLLLLTACTDDFAAVQEADTIQAYEEYLAENPNTRFGLEAGIRLEELYLEKARSEKTLEAYDLYLSKYPDGIHNEAATKEREGFLFAWAKSNDTIEAYEKYLKEYPSGPYKTHRTEARSRLAMAGYRDSITVGEVKMKQVNLAEQKNGPLDGWAFTAEITNNGDKTLSTLKLELSFLGADDAVLLSKVWPVASPRYETPVEEFRKKPLKPNESREWEFWTGDIPEGWTDKVALKPALVAFARK